MPPSDALQQALADAQQAIRDFDFADGLTVTARAGEAYLALRASADGLGFEYRAAREDLEREGSTWFIRRALRSLNDRYEAGNLDPAAGGLEHEYLRPPDQYPGD